MNNIRPKIPEGAEGFIIKRGHYYTKYMFFRNIGSFPSERCYYDSDTNIYSEWELSYIDISLVIPIEQYFDDLYERVGLKPNRTLESSAIETLTRLGYTWAGGELWKPPICKKPIFMEDLTTITEPFGELSRDIQLELVKHLLGGEELNRVYLDGEVYGSVKLEGKLSLELCEGYSIKKKKTERELLEGSLTSKLKEVEVLVAKLKINNY
jgi:hypothetical protein